MQTSLPYPSDSLHLVVFDMAGTTVYDDDFVSRAFRDALEAHGLSVASEEANAVMGYPKPVAVRKLLAAREGKVTQERVAAIHEDFLARMNRFYAEDPAVREIDGAGEVFRKLRDQGIRIALNTGFSRTTADIILDRLGWLRDGLVDAVVASDEVINGRPYPDMIFRAMALTEVNDPILVAKVGDTPSDLLEGRAAGCRFNIGVTYGTHGADELAPYPHTHLIDTLGVLPDLLLAERVRR